MGLFINSQDHSHSNGIVFLLGAIFNILANTDFSNLLDYTLKALIGGFIWLLYKLIADYISARSKSKEKKAEIDNEKDKESNA